jgi:hypothetical protein
MQVGEPKASDGPIMMATARIRIMRTVIAKGSPRMRAKKRAPVWPVNNWPASDTDQTRTVGKNRLKIRGLSLTSIKSPHRQNLPRSCRAEEKTP